MLSAPVKSLLLLTVIFGLSGCENPVKRAVRNAKYSGYEMFGIQKRDLLKRSINENKEDQKEAAETFSDSLEKLRTLYGMESTDLERKYSAVKSSYDESERKASAVINSRKQMETVAGDLFREWEKEINEIQTPSMKSESKAKLKESRARFSELNRGLLASEKKMNSVLALLKDHVLFLKHNLNAQSLLGLDKERSRVENDIQALIKEMNSAIAQSDQYLKSIE
jgi:hypothetical protein